MATAPARRAAESGMAGRRRRAPPDIRSGGPTSRENEARQERPGALLPRNRRVTRCGYRNRLSSVKSKDFVAAAIAASSARWPSASRLAASMMSVSTKEDLFLVAAS
jgi:hypothetical protein